MNTANNIAQNIVAVTAPAIAILDASMQANQIHLSITAQPGFTYAILASTNLFSWTPISTNTASQAGTIKFTDTDSTNHTTRYYRTMRLP